MGLQEDGAKGAHGQKSFILSEEEIELVTQLREMKLSEETFKAAVESLHEEQVKIKKETPHLQSNREEFNSNYSTPHLRISNFSGDMLKDVNFKTWEFEVCCLVDKYPESAVLNVIRRSVKGEAANILHRLGVNATVSQILQNSTVVMGI